MTPEEYARERHEAAHTALRALEVANTQLTALQGVVGGMMPAGYAWGIEAQLRNVRTAIAEASAQARRDEAQAKADLLPC
jgi:hypothetical protein